MARYKTTAQPAATLYLTGHEMLIHFWNLDCCSPRLPSKDAGRPGRPWQITLDGENYSIIARTRSEARSKFKTHLGAIPPGSVVLAF